MKRNFLLTLLLTLLPFAGWAAPGYQLTGFITGTENNAWEIGTALPTLTEESQEYFSVRGYYDSEGNPVSSITEVGWYYVGVVSEGGDPYYEAFQAWKAIPTEFINNAATFNKSVISGALQLYYEEYTSKGTDDEKAAYLAESKSWEIAAAKTADKTVNGKGFPWVVFKSTESVPCRVSFVYDAAAPVYPWTSFHTNNIFFSTTDKKYGVASINEELGKGQVWYDPTDEHADAEGNVENYKSNWVDSKFAAYFTPAELTQPAVPAFKAVGNTYNVMVSGVNGQTKTYGEELELSVSLITTNKDEINESPALMNAIMNKLELVYDLKYEPVGNDKYYYIRLKEGVIPTTVTENGSTFVYTYGTDYVDVSPESSDENDFGESIVDRYIIKPTGSGTIEITAATDNAFEAPMGTVYTDLVYNGKEQILINEPAKAKYGDVVYYASNEEVANFDALNAAWVPSTDIKGKNAGNYYVYAKVEATDNYNGIEPTLLYAPTTVDNEPGLLAPGPARIAPFDLANVAAADAAKYKPKGNAWAYDGTAHNIAVEPEAMSDMADLTVLYATEVSAEDADWKAVDNFKATKNADPKTVFWKIVGNDNIAAVAPAETQVVEATISKAQVDLALENGKRKIALNPTSYWYKGGAEIAIGTPSGVTYTPNNLGGTLKYFIEKKDGGLYTSVTDNKVTAKGEYRYNAKFVGNADVADAGPMSDAQCATFEVVQPTVAISTTVTPGVVGVGAVPTCGWTAKWDDADHLDQIVAPANVTYTYYRKNSWGRWQQVQPSSFEAGQTIQVRVNVSQFSTKKGTDAGYTTVAEGTWATFTVASSQIEAEIEPGTFAYGQVLPLTIKYVSGFGEGEDAADNIEAFNEASRSGFMKAKMIRDAEGNEVTNGRETTLEYKRERYFGEWYTLNKENLPVGTYKVSANFENNNQLIITKTAEWTIVPKDITNADVTYDADGKTDEFEVYGIGTSKLAGDEFTFSKTYSGEQIVPTVRDFEGIYFSYAFVDLTGEDFEIVGPTDKKANIDAGEGTFTIKGKGNFTGEKELTFTIAKKEVTARPIAATWAIGSEPAFKVDYDDLYTQLVPRDQKDEDGDSEFDIETAAGFKDLKVRRLADVTVGTYANGIEAYLPADAEPAKNYDIKPGTAALTITKGKISLKLNSVNAVYNGKNTPVIAYDFTPITTGENASTLSEVMLDNDNWKTVIGTPDNPTWTEADGWNIKFKLDPTKEGDDGRYVAGKTYTIQYDENALIGGKKNSELMTSTNYDVTVDVTEATVTITKAPLTITVLPQSKDVDQINKNVIVGTTVEVEGWKDGETIEMSKLVGENKIYVDGNKELNLDKSQSGYGVNYEVKVVPGKLTIVPNDLLVLESDGTDPAKIAAADKKSYSTIQVTIKPSRMKVSGENNYFDWKADNWHAMVLPFAASVSQISRAFSFAIVNVADWENTKEGRVAFKLPSATATIPANTPFCLKASKDIKIGNKEYTATFSRKEQDELEEGETNY